MCEKDETKAAEAAQLQQRVGKLEEAVLSQNVAKGLLVRVQQLEQQVQR